MVRRVKQKYVRSALNTGQVSLLELVYKYRFVSRQLAAESLGVKPENGLYEKLEILVKGGHLGRRFDKRLKLQGVPAAYYLTPKGLRALQALDGHDYITEATIKSSYRDKVVSQAFVNHTLDVYRYTNVLKQQHQELKVYLRRDITRYHYFPDNPPDAFLSLKLGDTPLRFFLDVIPDTLPRNLLDRRIADYAEFFEDGGWEKTNSELPKLLFITEKGTTENRTRRTIRAALSRADMDDELEAYTTTFTALQDAAAAGTIWASADYPDDRLSLPDL